MKKKYINPQVRLIKIETLSILAGSPTIEQKNGESVDKLEDVW